MKNLARCSYDDTTGPPHASQQQRALSMGAPCDRARAPAGVPDHRFFALSPFSCPSLFFGFRFSVFFVLLYGFFVLLYDTTRDGGGHTKDEEARRRRRAAAPTIKARRAVLCYISGFTIASNFKSMLLIKFKEQRDYTEHSPSSSRAWRPEGPREAATQEGL